MLGEGLVILLVELTRGVIGHVEQGRFRECGGSVAKGKTQAENQTEAFLQNIHFTPPLDAIILSNQ
ncbi:hypothetical protein D3C72_2592610 [compost metagenome]